MADLSDAQAREAALDPSRSFIVQAPAGSGKTELLVRRFLTLLKTVERPEEILAITFTKKAAAEMRKRVLEKIPNPQEIGHRLRIETIDALCASLTKQMPVLARFGAQPEVAEDPSELYREAAARVFQSLDPATENVLRHLDNNVALATAMLAELLRSRDRWLRKTGAAPTKQELEAAFASERERVLGRARALHPKASEEMALQFLTQKNEWTKRPVAPQELQQIPGLLEALVAVRKLPPATYDERQWAVLEAILALLLPAVSQLKVIFGETGKADFTEFSHGALQALGSADDPSDLLLALDRRISHILVDEFQDTSLSQYELLEKLTSGWQPGDGRTLFLVGDPMQSIYRFREAEVGLFLASKKTGLGSVRLESLTLQTNFRSQQGIVDWVNASFARVLPALEEEASGAVPYSPAVAKHPPLPGAAATWHGFYDRASESSEVIKILREAKGKTAILVRNRAHLDEIVPALKDAGLRFKAVEIEQLGEKQVVQDLYALTRALTHLGDRVAWLAVLRAPWCGLTLEDLSRLAEGKPEPVWDLLQSPAALSTDGQKRAARVRTALGPALANRSRGMLRDAVEGAWLALGGPACVGDATDLADADIYLDELERLEEAGAVDFGALAASLGKLYALPDVEAGEGAVEIMTIHKAKGLEFDTVIVPGLDRTPRAGPRPLFAWKTVQGGRLLLAPIDEAGGGDDPAYKYIRELDREAEDIEAARLFYVAATRARQRLHLLGCAKCDDHGDIREPFFRSLLAKIWWQAREHFGPPPAQAAEEAKPPIPNTLYRLPADFESAAPPPPAAWTAPAEEGGDPEIEFSWAGETARHVGTVVHRWLQRIADDALAGWDPARVERLKPRFAHDLQRRGVPSSELKASTDLVALALKNSITDDRGRWILGPHPEARTEYRMRVRTPSGMRHYIMDRVFRTVEGQQWVVDYKTSRHEGANVEAFLNREQERYAAQISSYSELLPRSTPGLYFPALRGWRAWNR